MASPQMERLALTPKTPVTTLSTATFNVSESGGRVLRTPLTDEAIWKRLKEAGFDEESIKRRDKAALISNLARLQAEKYDIEHHMGLLILERKEWVSKYDQLKAAAESAEFSLKREQAAHTSDLAEANKREDALKKALAIEKECVANIEKALHEMRAQFAEAKVAAESKLAEARTMMEDAQNKLAEAQAKFRAAESLEAEASRYHCTAERKLREVEGREDDLRRQITSFKSECDTKENEIHLERQALRERQKVLQQSQERLLDGQSLLNQREEYIFSRSQELNRLEKQLEASKLDLENECKGLTEKKQNLNLLETSLSAREEAVIKKEHELKKNEEELVILQGKLASKEFDGLQQAMDDHETALNLKKCNFEAELEMKCKLVEEEIEAKRRTWELKEIDMKQKEELLKDKEHDIEIQAKAIVEKEKDLEERFHSLEEKERSLVAAEGEVELTKSLLEQEKEEINCMKLELQKSLDSLEEKKKQISCAEEKMEVMTSETNDLLVLEKRLKEEIDMITAHKLELEAEADLLKAEKAKFEIEWELMDEKRGELRKEEERVAEERLAIYKFLKDERDNLKSEKGAMQDKYKHDLESLSRDREAFMSEIARERSEWFNKIQKERAEILRDIEMQKNDLVNRVEKRREEIESYLKERMEAFDEEKKKEHQDIASLRESALKEMEFVKLEMKRLDAEKNEINLDREKRDEEWAALNHSIEELKLQREKLEKQRELLQADRKEILAQIEELKKLEDLKHIPDRITPRKVLVKDRIDSSNGIARDSGRSDAGSSPLSAPLSWLKRCADTLLEQTPSSKKRRQAKDFAVESFSPSPLADEANAAEVVNAAKPISQTPVGAEETTVYIDKIITIREVTSVDVGSVTGNSQEFVPQESDEKLDNNDGLKTYGNGKLETEARVVR
ncbi:hypothetical protein ACH5RR_013934 [Cinchona calisaya]|uniref:Nuclear matrix constituent protein 1-like protein n=1 Tax=Cinchona calisaya TaxID=153742 RepID=A0ABD3A436_9GENT